MDLALLFPFSPEVIDCFGIMETDQTGCQSIRSVPSKQVLGCPEPATGSQIVPFLTAGSGPGGTVDLCW